MTTNSELVKYAMRHRNDLGLRDLPTVICDLLLSQVTVCKLSSEENDRKVMSDCLAIEGIAVDKFESCWPMTIGR